ncbi:alcohol dehydrogenase catalytic domain-containing protein [Bacillus sp. AC79A.1]
MEVKVVLIEADKEPVPGVKNPTPNQVYKNVKVLVKEKSLDSLHADEIRVEMKYVGICGTDIHLTTNNPETGYICSTAPLSVPKEGRIIGHEGVGKIIKVGSNIKHLKPGMYVTLESIINCNRCDVCRRGNFNQCRNAKLLGLEKDGLLGTVVDVPAQIAHDVTEFIDNDEDLMATACIEPAGVAYVACENAQIKAGDRVVIFGAGPIGILVAALSKSVFGASEVHVIEPIKYRRNFVKQWADKVYSNEEFLREGPQNIDVIIEASGFLENVEKIFRKIDANGRVVSLARSGTPLTIRDIDHMITNQITIIGSRGHLCGAFNSILRLQKARKINLSDIITKIVEDLDELKGLLENNEALTKENCKVLVDMAKVKLKKEENLLQTNK